MVPATSDRNFTPSSTALSGPPSTSPGTVVLDQMVTTAGMDTMAMTRLSDLVAVCMGLPASLTWTVKLKVPAAVGVPEMAPLLGLSVRPGGRDPLATDQVYGRVPPLAVNVVV